MNRAELVDIIKADTGLTKKAVNAVLDSFRQTVAETVAEGDKLTLIGFGSFEKIARAEREGINPQTKEALTIPASYRVKFAAGKAFRDAVNGVGDGKLNAAKGSKVELTQEQMEEEAA